MNLVPGRLVAGSPPRFEAAGGISLALEARGQAALAGDPQRAVMLGIRPEDLTHRTAAADGATLQTRVELVELLGGEGIVHLTAGPVELTARIPAPVPAAGEMFAIRIPPDRTHFFDATTTERIAL
jgi:ABC-type sugar transport system ATPase subunit